MLKTFSWVFITSQLFVLAITAPVFFKKSSRSLQNGSFVKTPDLPRFAEDIHALSDVKWDWHCFVCGYTVSSARKMSSTHKSQMYILRLVYELCKRLHVQDDRVCNGAVQVFGSEFFFVINNITLTSEEICGIVVGPQCVSPKDPYDKWNVTFSKTPKPPVSPVKLPMPGSPTLRVLQISDIHLDPFYQEGTNAQCAEPLCCRADNGPPKKGTPGAGKWGDYGSCDLPSRTLVNLFEHLNSIQDDFDLIYWTGDLPPHDVWNQSRSDQITSINVLTKLFLKYLPDKPVFPVVGNHESAPVNSFPPAFIKGKHSINWLYSALKESWSHWLPKETYGTIMSGAYYTVSPFPGFRIVSINSNYCNSLNWWLMLNLTDPNQELEWLVKVLQAAEDDNEKVHILGHIPPGETDCLTAWSSNYYRIISRYESTVLAQFFGHIHQDSYEMFYDVDNMKRPISVAYIAGSVTPYLAKMAVNPSFRIYEVDGNYNFSSWAILDFESYIMDLKTVNALDEPEWILEYSPKDAYDMPSLNPDSWDNLIETMKTNNTVFEKFYRYKYKSAPNGKCSAACHQQLLCSLRSGRSNDPSLCKDL